MKTILKLSLILFFTLSVVACNNKQPSKTVTQFGEINVITPADFKEKSANQTIVDIRTPQEFAEGYIEGAININLFDKNFLDQMAQFDKSKPIFIYCRSGNRTSSASKKLSELGFQQVYDLQGGIINWSRNNQPITK